MQLDAAYTSHDVILGEILNAGVFFSQGAERKDCVVFLFLIGVTKGYEKDNVLVHMQNDEFT